MDIIPIWLNGLSWEIIYGKICYCFSLSSVRLRCKCGIYVGFLRGPSPVDPALFSLCHFIPSRPHQRHLLLGPLPDEKLRPLKPLQLPWTLTPRKITGPCQGKPWKSGLMWSHSLFLLTIFPQFSSPMGTGLSSAPLLCEQLSKQGTCRFLSCRHQSPRGIDLLGTPSPLPWGQGGAGSGRGGRASAPRPPWLLPQHSPQNFVFLCLL